MVSLFLGSLLGSWDFSTCPESRAGNNANKTIALNSPSKKYNSNDYTNRSKNNPHYSVIDIKI